MNFIFMIWLIILPGFLQEQPDVEVYQVEKGRYVEVWAKNNEPYPVTMMLSVELDNMKADRPLPLTSVIPNGTNQVVTRLYPADPEKPWKYNVRYGSFMGDIYAKPEANFAYRLPYRTGDTFSVSQGYGGAFSHTENITFSLDFDLPEGTPVFSARGGVVVDMKQDSNEGGEADYYRDKANYVTILHNDGTFGDYLHLQKNTVRVRVGQKIRAGQQLALSGSTGFITGPHLHFHVKIAQEGGKYTTIPVKFSTRDGVIELEEGKSYMGW